MSDDALNTFARDLAEEILGRATLDGEQTRGEAFCEHHIDLLIEAGEFENAVSSFHKTRGIEVHGYGIDDEDTLNLLTVHSTAAVPPDTLIRTDSATALRRLNAFWTRCRDTRYHEELEPSSPAHDMARAIHDAAQAIRRVRLILITDAQSPAEQLQVETSPGGVEERRVIWDIRRLHHLETSGREREPIEVDFPARFGAALPCLPGPTGADDDYQAMLAIIPGPWLADIYEEHGPRLLELNVRSFLQASGKVNRGIRDTLRHEPDRFLAYNNGISATAGSVEFTDLPGGGRGITTIRDLQIVNGGQTTASVHRAMLARIDLTHVSVQAKITVAAPGQLDTIVPLISRYANSQNKVSEADLSANEPFHVEIEKLSRSTWTPATDAQPRETHWFYERARGQYRDAVFRAGTPARQRAYKQANPPEQRFDKTALAKYEHAYDQLPHHVSRGAQKNFTAFMTNLARRNLVVDRELYRQLIAKALLWKRTERLVSQQSFGGYRANIVAYAIAKLSHATAQRIDLQRIWETQALTPATETALIELSQLAWRNLVEDAPPGVNITEWAKREECWKQMRSTQTDAAAPLTAELLTPHSAQGAASGADSPPMNADTARVSAIGAAGWTSLADWAKQTGSLADWQRKLAADIARRLASGRRPTPRQTEFATAILTESERLGFTPPAPAP